MVTPPATRNVTFTFAEGAGADATASMKLTVVNAAGFTVATVPLAAGATTCEIVLPVATGYVATLTSYDSAGTPDPSPPTQTFDVTASSPSSSHPNDPTLNAPTLS